MEFSIFSILSRLCQKTSSISDIFINVSLITSPYGCWANSVWLMYFLLAGDVSVFATYFFISGDNGVLSLLFCVASCRILDLVSFFNFFGISFLSKIILDMEFLLT
uniref:Uncharacterized protein n=1 Tax=Cacopsylla melanoneura TaxID=428564 RepID=A0A8D9E997_9HEMI